jgi:putative DNA primase/helicase
MTTPQQPGGLKAPGSDWMHDPLKSDAEAAQVAAEMALPGCCWAGGLGWRRYNRKLGTWPAVPEEDIIEQIRLWVLGSIKVILEKAAAEAASGDDKGSEHHRKVAGEWHKLGSAGRLAGITRLARGICHVPAERFDTHPDLMNTPGGVVDLRTGKPGKHDPSLLLTQVAGVGYVPGARHPDIDKALEAIPEDVRAYAQLRYGQAITGYKPPDDVIDVQHGQGENGKTTILAAIKNAVGDYAEVLPTKLLYINPGTHSTELMSLRGMRVGIIEELPEEHQLAVAAIKIATAPRITARLVHKDNVTFDNVCALIISTNYRLQIRETDHGTWRRLEGSIPYPYTYRKPHEGIRDENDRRGDPTLRERVMTDKGERAQAMLAWLVEGAMRWYAGEPGRPAMTMGQPPQRVRQDVAAWRESCDLVYGYIAEQLVWDGRAHVISDDLLELFNGRIQARGHRRWAAETFTARFGAHSEVREHKVTKARIRAGQEGEPSRPPGWGQDGLPGQYTAWFGVRFRTIQDEETAGGAGCAGPKQTSLYEAKSGEFINSPAHPAQRSSNGPVTEGFAALFRMADFEGT